MDGYKPDNLKAAFAGWFGASGETRDSFRDLLLQPGMPDKVVDDIRAAARDIVSARTQDDLHRGGAALASAAQAIGPYKWAQFVADSSRCAETAISSGKLPGVTQISATDTALGTFGGIAILGAAIWWLFGGSKSGSASKTMRSPPTVDLPVVAPATPPRDAKDPNGAKAPGKPGPEQDFKDPKGGGRWVPNPNGKGYGWLDASGDVWVPSGHGDRAHAGPHWDVQTPGGKYRNVLPPKQEGHR